MQFHWKTYLLSLAIGTPCVIAGVVFRPFWQSAWGPPTFLALTWVVLLLAFAWGARGTQRPFLTGTIMSGGITLCFITVWLVHLYAGLVLLALFIYVAVRTRFLERLGSSPQQPRSSTKP